MKYTREQLIEELKNRGISEEYWAMILDFWEKREKSCFSFFELYSRSAVFDLVKKCHLRTGLPFA